MNFLVDANGWDLKASLVDIYNLPARQRAGTNDHE